MAYVIEKSYKQQIIFAVYLDVWHLSYEDTCERMNQAKKMFSDSHVSTEKNITHYIIPVTDGQPTRIECIYPKFVSANDDLIKDFKQSIDNLGDKYYDFFRHMFSYKNELLIEKISEKKWRL